MLRFVCSLGVHATLPVVFCNANIKGSFCYFDRSATIYTILRLIFHFEQIKNVDYSGM